VGFVKRHACWGITQLNTLHRGHFPRNYLPDILSDTDAANIAIMHNIHGIATSSLVSQLRAEGKIFTSQQILNALNKFDNATQSGGSESENLLHAICNEPDSVFVVRFIVIDGRGEARGHVNFLKVPGYRKLVALDNGLLYDECGNIIKFEQCTRRPCVLDRYSLFYSFIVKNLCYNSLYTLYTLFMHIM